ncbi:MAG: hypothetical protein FJ297_08640 [Planctomycetes bacterium]|nr:hypothetical protein [Planctomycetota bacterium]
MYAVGLAIDLHLRALDVRRTSVEEAQIARSVLQMIANDLRGAVRRHEVDMSSIEELALQSLAGSAASALGGAAGGMGGGDATGGTGGSSGTTGGSSGSSSGLLRTDGASGGSNTPPGTSGSSGSGTGASGSGSSGSGSSGSGSSGSGGMVSEDGSTDNTQDLTSTTTLPPVPGVYGNAYQLQIDVSRLPRVDQYQTILDPNSIALPRIPSDIKTVTYFVQTPAIGGGQITDPLAQRGQANQPAVGLMRREVDRAVLEYAIGSGGTESLMRTGDVLAPEITQIEFQYFDGATWYSAWDSDQMGGPPVAVDVVLAITPKDAQQRVGLLGATAAASIQPIVYRLTIHLPLGAPPPEEETTDDGMQNLGL